MWHSGVSHHAKCLCVHCIKIIVCKLESWPNTRLRVPSVQTHLPRNTQMKIWNQFWINVNVTFKEWKRILVEGKYKWKELDKKTILIARFMGPTWGTSGADRAQVGPMLAPWTLLSGYLRMNLSNSRVKTQYQVIRRLQDNMPLNHALI